MLLGADREQLDGLALLEIRQHPLLVVIGPGHVVAALEIDAHEARLGDGRAGRPEVIAGPATEIDRDQIQQRMRHLASQGALPDQLIEPRLVVGQMGLDLLRLPPIEVGRIASWASCAFFDLVLNSRACGGK